MCAWACVCVLHAHLFICEFFLERCWLPSSGSRRLFVCMRGSCRHRFVIDRFIKLYFSTSFSLSLCLFFPFAMRFPMKISMAFAVDDERKACFLWYYNDCICSAPRAWLEPISHELSNTICFIFFFFFLLKLMPMPMLKLLTKQMQTFTVIMCIVEI